MNNNNKAIQGKPGNGMMIEGNIKNSKVCATINPYENFKMTEEKVGTIEIAQEGEIRKIDMDTIIIGEVKGQEALELFETMSKRHVKTNISMH